MQDRDNYFYTEPGKIKNNIKYIFGVLFVCVLCMSNSIKSYGYTGTGTKENPYVVTAESGFREILTQKGSNSWIYIAVNNNITIRKNIAVTSGKFRIFAKGNDRIVKRSSDMSDQINDQNNPSYCMIVSGGAQVDFGYAGLGDYILRLGGNKSYFTGTKRSSGWLYIKNNSKVIIDKNAWMTNVKNNKYDGGSAAISCDGELYVLGSISNCEGADGGAIKTQGGHVVVSDTGHIYECYSNTEGGGIFGNSGCNIEINGGTVGNCESKEEGGGIFVGEKNSYCKIYSGYVAYNNSGMTGGGVFAGYGANLIVGKTDGTGPVITHNNSGTSGGGIRCNGGIGDNSGGTSYFYGGTVSYNTARKNSGGISCGSGNGTFNTKIYLSNMNIVGNVSKEGSGGVRLPSDAIGTDTAQVNIKNCTFNNNSTDANGGGLMMYCAVTVSDSVFTGNYSGQNGGGIYINGGKLVLLGGVNNRNTSGGEGQGVYVAGQFIIKNDTYVDESNHVYLTKGTYIDVIGKLTKQSGYVAKIKSQINDNGTKLVKVNYNGATAVSELYYPDDLSTEKFQCISMSSRQLLRGSENVNGFENYWIIISEKYIVNYNTNTNDTVENMPHSQTKYWNEDIALKSTQPTRAGYELNIKKHWNEKPDGSGTIYSPGSVLKENEDKNLYAIWRRITVKEIYIYAVDRYYVLNQNVTLGKKELLKKVKTDDDLHTGYDYSLRVTMIEDDESNTIKTGKDIACEYYIDTSQIKHYILTLETESENGEVRAVAKMNVYIMNTDLSNGQVRFISYDYLYTLDKYSKWNTRLNSKLKQSLSGKEERYCIEIKKEDISDIKSEIKNKKYIRTNAELVNIIKKLKI